jgi:hypothetical protein
MRDDRNRKATEKMAAHLAEHASPAEARALTGGKSDKLTSEQAHQQAARIAREREREEK